MRFRSRKATRTGARARRPWTQNDVGPQREGEELSPLMYGNEKSDPAIVAVKPTNNARQLAAELVEPRVGAEGRRASEAHAPGAGSGKRVPGAGTRATHEVKGDREGMVGSYSNRRGT